MANGSSYENPAQVSGDEFARLYRLFLACYEADQNPGPATAKAMKSAYIDAARFYCKE